MKSNQNPLLYILTAIILLSAASCAGKAPAATPTPTLEPTPTEAPMAARVNGEGILLSEYEAELQRYQAALQTAGETYDPAADSQEVIDELINQTLLAQAAAAQNYAISDPELQTEIDELSEQAGGDAALQAWMSQNYYNDVSFRIALKA